jgi:hypothetical protein
LNHLLVGHAPSGSLDHWARLFPTSPNAGQSRRRGDFPRRSGHGAPSGSSVRVAPPTGAHPAAFVRRLSATGRCRRDGTASAGRAGSPGRGPGRGLRQGPSRPEVRENRKAWNLPGGKPPRGRRPGGGRPARDAGREPTGSETPDPAAAGTQFIRTPFGVRPMPALPLRICLGALESRKGRSRESARNPPALAEVHHACGRTRTHAAPRQVLTPRIRPYARIGH